MNRVHRWLNPKHLLKVVGLCGGVYVGEQIVRPLYSRSLANLSPEEKNQLYQPLPQETLHSLLQSMEQLHVLDSPLMDRLMSVLRDKDTSCDQFRACSDRVIRQLLEHALSLDLEQVVSSTPCGLFTKHQSGTPQHQMCAITILRAGNSFMGQLLELMPSLPIGQVLIQRNESSALKEPVFFYSKLPALQNKKVLICDPMIATGGSMVLCLEQVVQQGIPEQDITVVGVIACQEGLEAIHNRFPKVKVVVGVVDPVLNAEKYICPGLGDFGDRYFGTL